MGLRIITAPTVEPVTVAEVKTFARIDATGDPAADVAQDALLASLIAAAREAAESLLSRSTAPTQLELSLSSFPRMSLQMFGSYSSENVATPVELPRPPLLSVGAVAYLDTDGVEQVLPPTAYTTEQPEARPALLFPVGDSWPETNGTRGAVRILYTAGWPVTGTGAAADPVAGTPADPYVSHAPETIKLWIKHWVASRWATREPTLIGSSPTMAAEMPGRFLDGLLDRWRIMEAR